MFLLDTNVVSELRKAGDGKADANLTRWLAGVDAESLFLSVITIFELELGVLFLEKRDPVQGARLRSWMKTRVLPEFSTRILQIDTAVALRSAALHVPDPCPLNDAYIAATALVHGMTVVTRNVEDFEPMGVALLNPWETPA